MTMSDMAAPSPTPLRLPLGRRRKPAAMTVKRLR